MKMWKNAYRVFVLAMVLFLCRGMEASAKYGDIVEWQGRTVAIMDEQGQMMYQPIGDNGELETQALQYLLGNDRKKTLMFPEGSTINLNRTLEIGSNTTLIATGVTVVQAKPNTCLLTNRVDQPNYHALENVLIRGGIWKNKVSSDEYYAMCFIQASNITMENATVQACDRGNGIRLMACRKVTLSACEIRAEKSKKKAKSPEQAAIEMLPATPLLTKSYVNGNCVNGEVCSGIYIKECIIHGGLGIHAGYANREKKYRDKLHSGIRITGCTVTGTATEAVALENTVGYTVKNNLLITRAKAKEGIHASGMLAQLSAKKVKNKKDNLISGNVVYGVRYGILVRSKTSGRYGRTKVLKNRSHVKGKKKNAIVVKHCRKKILKNNKSYRSS